MIKIQLSPHDPLKLSPKERKFHKLWKRREKSGHRERHRQLLFGQESANIVTHLRRQNWLHQLRPLSIGIWPSKTNSGTANSPGDSNRIPSCPTGTCGPATWNDSFSGCGDPRIRPEYNYSLTGWAIRGVNGWSIIHHPWYRVAEFGLVVFYLHVVVFASEVLLMTSRNANVYTVRCVSVRILLFYYITLVVEHFTRKLEIFEKII